MLVKKSQRERCRADADLSHTSYLFCCKHKLKFTKIGTMLLPNVFYY